MLKSLMLFLIVSIVAHANAKPIIHAKATVKNGENLAKFLDRFHLETHDCNVSLFCSLNKLKNKNHIEAKKEYLLPVKLVKHNGKSVRSSVGIKDKEMAKKIESYNSKLIKEGLKSKRDIKRKLLWVPLYNFECQDKQEEIEEKLDDDFKSTKNTKEELNIKPKSEPKNTSTILKRKGVKEIHAPLMGDGYSTVNIEDFTLEGQVYYIISGHGGPDPGAVCTDCPSTLCEDEYAYDVSLRLARDLMQHGATVHVIVQDKNDGIRDEEYLKCDNDERLIGGRSIPLNQKKRLRERAESVNAMYRKYKKKGVKIQKAIEIHVDSRSKEKRQDVFFYYNKSQKSGKELAMTVQDVFDSKYDKHQKDRGYQGYIEERGLYMVRNLLPTTLFVELANIKNPEDHKRLLVNSNRQALANWLFEGLRK